MAPGLPCTWQLSAPRKKPSLAARRVVKERSVLLRSSHGSLSRLGLARLSVAVPCARLGPARSRPGAALLRPQTSPFTSPLFRMSPGHLRSVHAPVLTETIGMCELAIPLSASLLPVCFLRHRDTSLRRRVHSMLSPLENLLCSAGHMRNKL